MFGTPRFMTPGSMLRKFEVYRTEGRETERGRVIIDHRQKIGAITAVLAQMKPDEQYEWHQQGSPATHKIIMEGPNEMGIRAGDLLVYQGRCFYVARQGYDPGELGHWTIFHCNERHDVASV
jgi:hypothetical protein